MGYKTTGLLFMSFLAVMASCDEGRLYDDYIPQESGNGLTARLTATVEGAGTWAEGYSLSLAGFAEGNEYALISKAAEPDADGRIDMTLSSIPAEVTSVELCVTDRLRRRTATFLSAPVAGDDTIRITADEKTDVSMYGVIQRDIFNTTCTQCHGGSNHAAGGLSLTEGKSYYETVGVPSVKDPDRLRAMPGASEESVLYRILSTDESAGWRYDHSVEIPDSKRLDVIKNWIDSGCPR